MFLPIIQKIKLGHFFKQWDGTVMKASFPDKINSVTVYVCCMFNLRLVSALRDIMNTEHGSHDKNRTPLTF